MFRWLDSNIYSCGGSLNQAEFFSPIQVTAKKCQRAAWFFCHPGSYSNTALVQNLWNSKFPIPINNVNMYFRWGQWMKQVSSLSIHLLCYTVSSKWEVKHLVMLNCAKYSLQFIFPLKHFFPTPCVKWGQHLPHRDDMRLHSLIFAKCFEILGWEALQKCKGLSVIKRKEKVQQLESIRGK